MNMSIESLSSKIEISNLSSTARLKDIEYLCSFAKTRGCAATLVNPCFFICTVKNTVGHTGMKNTASINYPYGCDLSSVKVYSAKQCEIMGAEGINLVINLSAFLSGNLKYVKQEIDAVTSSTKTPLTVVFESSLLNEAEITSIATVIAKTSVAYVQDGTGYLNAPANAKAIEILRSTLPESIGIKSAAKFESAQELIKFEELGVDYFCMDISNAEPIFLELYEMQNTEA